MKREELLNDYLKNSEIARLELEKEKVIIEEDLIWQLLQIDLGHTDVPTEVLFHKLSSDGIVKIVMKYVSSETGTLTLIELNSDIELYEVDEFLKAEIKLNGERWIIHRYDADPHPSKPHAHLMGTNKKLHLGKGEIYVKNECIALLPKKKLLLIRETFKKNFPQIKLPRLLI